MVTGYSSSNLNTMSIPGHSPPVIQFIHYLKIRTRDRKHVLNYSTGKKGAFENGHLTIFGQREENNLASA